MNRAQSMLRRLRIQAPPTWGIEPVPAEQRRLRGLDLAVLWSSLGIGLLILQAGTLLVPGLSLPGAFEAILVGSVIGALLLALTGLLGSDSAAPTMVLLRPVLGRQGSYLATLFNVAQLVGWTAFEIWIIALTASRISQVVFGAAYYPLWFAAATLVCLLLALGGPLILIRGWLERFGFWVMLAASLWITIVLVGSGRLGQMLAQPGNGKLPFWLAVDLVVAMPISWLPVVADYSRFARRSPGAFWGTFAGFALANIWFYALGALFVLILNLNEPAADTIGLAVVGLTGGLVALFVILVDEMDNVFASIYSAAVSAQNIFPRLSQRGLIVAVTAVAAFLAAALNMTQYYDFLLLIGSVFVPLFGVLAADYFIYRRQPYSKAELYGDDAGGTEAGTGRQASFNWIGLAAWAVGIVVYHAVARDLPWLGASIPSFLVAFAAYLGVKAALRSRERALAASRP